MTSRVVLVRGPRSSAGSGGGCCSADVRPFDEGGTHRHDAPSGFGPEPSCPPGDQMAALYLALRRSLPPDVDVHVVSPSNWLWLLPVLVSDGRRRGLRGAELRRSVRAGMVASSLVVDGAVLSSGGLPDPSSGVASVRAELALA